MKKIKKSKTEINDINQVYFKRKIDWLGDGLEIYEYKNLELGVRKLTVKGRCIGWGLFSLDSAFHEDDVVESGVYSTKKDAIDMFKWLVDKYESEVSK